MKHMLQICCKNNNGYFHFEKPFTGCVDGDMLSGFLEVSSPQPADR